MSSEGKVRVLVNSRKVPVRTILVTRPIITPTGHILGVQSSRAVIYDTTFDDSQRKAIKEAKRLSCNLDLDLEIVDRTKLNPFRRLFSSFTEAPTRSTSLTVSPSTS